MRDDLSENQGKILKFIIEYRKKNDGFTPTNVEIQKAFNYKAVSTAWTYVSYLKKKGYITVIDKVSRGIRIIEKGNLWYKENV